MGHHEDHLNKQLREKEEDQLLYEQTLEQLRTEERFVNFFKNYNASSVESFIKYYARQKVFWLRNKGNFGRYAQFRLERERKEVVGLLKHIMEKKIFNLQCRWVAGEMDLEGIEQTPQFASWENNAVLLNAVGPIRADEFYCYLDWYERGSPEKMDETGYSQATGYTALLYYHRMHSNYHEKFLDYLPEWFHEYDRHFGTASLHMLSTIRRDIEEDHLDIWLKEVHYPSLTPEQQKYHRVVDRATRKRLKEDPEFKKEWHEEGQRLYEEQEANRPKYEHFSVYDRKIMEEVVSAIEPRDVQKSYRLSRRWKEIREGDEALYKELEYLKAVQEYVAVSANDDHVESIKEAYEQHSKQTMHGALILLWEEYEACQRKGIAFDWGTSDHAFGHQEERRRILAVRKLKGLPENFDFMKKENLP